MLSWASIILHRFVESYSQEQRPRDRVLLGRLPPKVGWLRLEGAAAKREDG